MGKLRLTLTSLLFYIILFLSCFLAENFAFYNSNPLGGLNRSSLLLIAFLIILLLGFYYFLEHRQNKLGFDKFLLPALSICFLLMSLVVLWQNGLSNIDKAITIVQVFIWMVVLYTILFTNNRFNAIKRVSTIFAFTYFVFILICALLDLFIEEKYLSAIFNGTYSESGFRFVIYNPNVWGMMLLFGQLTAYVLSIKKFNILYYVSSIVLFLFNIMTTCTTTVFIGGVLLVLYTIYEGVCYFKNDRKKAIILLSSFFGSMAFIAILSTILYQSNVVGVVNLFDFLFSRTFIKDYSTFTHRTNIWENVFKILLENPRDFIFGLGFKNGNRVLENRTGFRSAHNGFIEIFLRHGLLGELIYLSALGLFVFSIVKLFKKKQYRFALISSALFLALLIHGFFESTTFFTPNIEGSYLLLAFYLPVVNVLQEKRLTLLKEDVEINKQEVPVIDKKNILHNILSIVLGLAVSFFVSSFIDSKNNQNTKIVFLIIALSLLVAIIITVIVVYLLIFKERVSTLFKCGLFRLITDNFFALLIVITLGLAFVHLIKQYSDINAFASVVTCGIIFTLYLIIASLLPNKGRKEFVGSTNQKYLSVLVRFNR